MKISLKSMAIVSSLIAGLHAMESDPNNIKSCPEEISRMFLTETLTKDYVNVNLNFKNFLEGVISLKEVCKEWNKIIDKDFVHNAMLLACKQICPEFLNGKLIYRPVVGSDEGMIELLISKLWNPLRGTFDLSGCGDTYNYLSISTGYRIGKRAENASKVEIWFAPRVLIEKELNTTAKHFQEIFPGNWNESAPVGMFWTWGGWAADDHDMDYLTTENMDNLSKIDLFENWKKAIPLGRAGVRGTGRGFHVHFVN
jgi:hypothetical protein